MGAKCDSKPGDQPDEPECKGTNTNGTCSICNNPWRGKDSTQIGLYVVLRDIKNGEIFSYVAAHCKSGKKKKDFPTKDAQAAFIAKLVTMLASNGLRPALGLDFNSNYKEKVIKTFKDGAKDMVSAYEQPEELKAAYTEYEKLKLTEKTAHQPEKNGEALMTAWKHRLFGEQLEKAGKQFKEELDYIFYQQYVWQVTRVLKVPQRRDIEECKMPGWKYPSDHFMIMAELELADWDKACQEVEEAIEEDIDEADAMLVAQGKKSGFLPLSAEEVLSRRRLADTARMEAKDVAAMSP